MRKLLALFLSLASGILLGVTSAIYVMERASFREGSGGGWRETRLTGDNLITTYQSAHLLIRGKVPPPSHVRIYQRSTDDDGNSLRPDCLNVVEGEPPDASWWSLGWDSAAGSHSLSQGEIIREASGQFIVNISPVPVPGNWLPTVPGKPYTLQIVLHDAAETGGNPLPRLPSVKRTWC